MSVYVRVYSCIHTHTYTYIYTYEHVHVCRCIYYSYPVAFLFSVWGFGSGYPHSVQHHRRQCHYSYVLHMKESFIWESLTLRRCCFSHEKVIYRADVVIHMNESELFVTTARQHCREAPRRRSEALPARCTSPLFICICEFVLTEYIHARRFATMLPRRRHEQPRLIHMNNNIGVYMYSVSTIKAAMRPYIFIYIYTYIYICIHIYICI